MRDIGKMINNTEKESKTGQKEPNTKANMSWASKMAKANILTPTVLWNLTLL